MHSSTNPNPNKRREARVVRSMSGFESLGSGGGGLQYLLLFLDGKSLLVIQRIRLFREATEFTTFWKAAYKYNFFRTDCESRGWHFFPGPISGRTKRKKIPRIYITIFGTISIWDGYGTEKLLEEKFTNVDWKRAFKEKFISQNIGRRVEGLRHCDLVSGMEQGFINFYLYGDLDEGKHNPQSIFYERCVKPVKKNIKKFEPGDIIDCCDGARREYIDSEIEAFVAIFQLRFEHGLHILKRWAHDVQKSEYMGGGHYDSEFDREEDSDCDSDVDEFHYGPSTRNSKESEYEKAKKKIPSGSTVVLKNMEKLGKGSRNGVYANVHHYVGKTFNPKIILGGEDIEKVGIENVERVPARKPFDEFYNLLVANQEQFGIVSYGMCQMKDIYLFGVTKQGSVLGWGQQFYIGD